MTSKYEELKQAVQLRFEAEEFKDRRAAECALAKLVYTEAELKAYYEEQARLAEKRWRDDA